MPRIDTRRCVDIAVGSVGCVVAGFAAAAIWAVTWKSPFYKQTRIGLNGKPFEFIKFQSMVDDCTKQPEERILPVWRSLRRSAFDELPQFYLILKGDMSLIGPRPMPSSEDEDNRHKIGEQWSGRYAVKPGLIPPTVYREKWLGEGDQYPEKRLADDLAYIDLRQNGSVLKRDCIILFVTTGVILMGRNDTHAQKPTLPPSEPRGGLNPTNVVRQACSIFRAKYYDG